MPPARDSGDRRADGARPRVPRVVANRSITQLEIPMPHSSNLDRRDFVGACLATVGAGLSLPANAGAQTAATDASVYTRLGLRPIVNAAGILTNLGGSLMSPEVKQAMEAASRHYIQSGRRPIAASARRPSCSSPVRNRPLAGGCSRLSEHSPDGRTRVRPDALFVRPHSLFLKVCGPDSLRAPVRTGWPPRGGRSARAVPPSPNLLARTDGRLGAPAQASRKSRH